MNVENLFDTYALVNMIYKFTTYSYKSVDIIQIMPVGQNELYVDN